MEITLNLARRPYMDIRPILKLMRVAMGSLVLSAVSLGAFLYVVHRRAEGIHVRAASLDAQIKTIVGEQQGYRIMMRRPENARILARTDTLNRLFDKKAFSWTMVMEELETVLPAGVQVTIIEPLRAKDDRIILHLRVLGPRDRSVELVHNLEHSAHFLQPRIVGESAETNFGPNDKSGPASAASPTDFDLLAEYNADSSLDPVPVEAAGALNANAGNVNSAASSVHGPHPASRLALAAAGLPRRNRTGGSQ
jgi:type IV pilus assembly protein PilN